MVRYAIIDTQKGLEELQTSLLSQEVFCFDLETTSLDTHSGDLEIVGMGFSWAIGEAYYVPCNSKLPRETVLSTLKVPLESESIAKVGFNSKYDARVCKIFDIEVAGIKSDLFCSARKV